MRAPIALVLAALALAGCAGTGGPVQGGYFSPECPPPQATARWTQPGLFEAFERIAAQRPDLLLPSDEDSLLPIHSARLAEWPGSRLLSLTRVGDGYWLRISSWRPGEVGMEMPYGEDEVALRRLDEVLVALGLAGSPERPAWERMLLASRGEGAYLHVTLVGRPDVDGFLDRVGPGELVQDDRSVGSLSFEWDGWRMHVRIPSHFVDLGNATHEMRLSVDARGRAEIWATIDDAARAYDELRERAGARFAQLGAPPPTFESATGGSSGCRPSA